LKPERLAVNLLVPSSALATVRVSPITAERASESRFACGEQKWRESPAAHFPS
jgi:hypothetical protein